MPPRAIAITTLTLALSGLSAFADSVSLPPADEARAQKLFREVRCVVCVAQPIAESDARLSEQMRDRIRTDIAAGLSNEDILASLSATYGDSIRLKPKVEPRTAILWAAPWAALILGALFIGLSRRRKIAAPSELSEADHER